MGVEILINPAAAGVLPDAGFGPESREPGGTHATLPGYRSTPLRSCPRLAARLGVGTVLVKDESQRLGLPAFKILGASWAVLTTVRSAWADGTEGPLTLDSVRASIGRSEDRYLVAATDGNHGRGVARMARLLGVGARIVVPIGMSAARIDAIRSEGAEVRVIDGSYDDAISAAAQLADAAHLVVSDTSWAGYADVPRAVVEGYSTLFFEIDDDIAARGLPPPDVVAFQAGVGSFAAAGIRHFRVGTARDPVTIVVEPTGADCLRVSAAAGRVVAVPGPHESSMAGLNCGTPSELVWPLIAAGTDIFVVIGDDYAEEAMRALAAEGIVAGESGAAGLAGLLALRDVGDGRTMQRAHLRPDACVLVVNTEGDTDPGNYLAVVGRTAEEVIAGGG